MNPTIFGLTLGIVLLSAGLLGAACEGAKPLAADASCSPKADAEFAADLALKCKGKPLSECPEADAIGDEYEKKAEEECSQ